MRKKIETLCRYIFRVSSATATLVDHDDKTAVVRWCDAKLAGITLVHSRGHLIRATRSHDLQEVTLADHGSFGDHPEISARVTDLYQSQRLKSVGAGQQPV